MNVETKMKLMNVMESYWDMLPPEIHEIILMLKRNQELLDQEKEKRMKELRKEIKLYKELKDKWAPGHIRCVVKKPVFFKTYVEIMGSYFDREDHVKREQFLGYDFTSALQRLNLVKSFM